MKKIILFLALLTGIKINAQIVGGYLPINSSKSATVGALRVNGALTATGVVTGGSFVTAGTSSVGSTFSVTGLATLASSLNAAGSVSAGGISIGQYLQANGTNGFLIGGLAGNNRLQYNAGLFQFLNSSDSYTNIQAANITGTGTGSFVSTVTGSAVTASMASGWTMGDISGVNRLRISSGVFQFVATGNGDANLTCGSFTAGGSILAQGTFSSTSTITGKHLIGNTSAPTIASGTGLGTGAATVVSVTRATDLSGIIGVVTGTASLGTSAVLATVTFNSAYGAAPNIVLTPANAAAASLMATPGVAIFPTTNTSTMALNTNTAALTASSTYSFFYTVVQ